MRGGPEDTLNTRLTAMAQRRIERGIVGWRTEVDSARLVADAVAVTRATREHEDIRQGSSVRAAIRSDLPPRDLTAAEQSYRNPSRNALDDCRPDR